MNDFEIYKKAAVVLKTGGNVALITVISTEGSTPGKVGYKMLVWEQDAQTLGTVGGGLVEAEAIDIAKGILPKPENRLLRFSFDSRTGSEKRGICGGVMELLVETFDQKSLSLFEELLVAIENGQKGALVSIISPKTAPKKVFVRKISDLRVLIGDFKTEIENRKSKIENIDLLVEQPERRTLQGGVEIFIEPVLEEAMVFIFGAGHLSDHICRYAKSVDFRVTVCDDRTEFANKNRFPDADNIVVESFETVFDRIEVTRNSYIVIVTRGHESDQIVLEKAVKTEAKYVGMIGSKKKTLTILKALHKKGLPEEALRRVYSPIGISIGAVTPQEIALSIICELTKIRRLGDAATPNHMKVGFSKNLGEEKL